MRLQPSDMANQPDSSPEIRAGVSQKVMNLFWGLSSTNDNERAKNTIDLLTALQQDEKLSTGLEKLKIGSAESSCDVSGNEVIGWICLLFPVKI